MENLENINGLSQDLLLKLKDKALKCKESIVEVSGKWDFDKVNNIQTTVIVRDCPNFLKLNKNYSPINKKNLENFLKEPLEQAFSNGITTIERDFSNLVTFAKHSSDRFPAQVMKSDSFIQYNHHFTRLHVDHACVTCHIPKSLKAIKIWLILSASNISNRDLDIVREAYFEVQNLSDDKIIDFVCRNDEFKVGFLFPGDVMVMKPGDHHAVYTVYFEDCKDRIALAAGQVYFRPQDLKMAIRFVTHFSCNHQKGAEDTNNTRCIYEIYKAFYPEEMEQVVDNKYLSAVRNLALKLGVIDVRKSQVMIKRIESKKRKALTIIQNSKKLRE